GLLGEADEVQFLVDQLLQPAAEGVGSAFLVEVAPGLVRLAVVGFDQAGKQLFQRLAVGQLLLAQGQAGGLAVRLLVNLMNNAVVDGHRKTATVKRKRGKSAGPRDGKTLLQFTPRRKPGILSLSQDNRGRYETHATDRPAGAVDRIGGRDNAARVGQQRTAGANAPGPGAGYPQRRMAGA